MFAAKADTNGLATTMVLFLRTSGSIRGPENGGKNAENLEPKEKRGMTDFPKRE